MHTYIFIYILQIQYTNTVMYIASGATILHIPMRGLHDMGQLESWSQCYHGKCNGRTQKQQADMQSESSNHSYLLSSTVTLIFLTQWCLNIITRTKFGNLNFNPFLPIGQKDIHTNGQTNTTWWYTFAPLCVNSDTQWNWSTNKKTRRIATANWWRISICGRPCKTLPHI